MILPILTVVDGLAAATGKALGVTTGASIGFFAGLFSGVFNNVDDNKINKIKAALKKDISDLVIFVAGNFYKDEDKSKFLDDFIGLINLEFKEKVIKVGKVSHLIGVNVETIRRKIRNNQIEYVKSETENRVIYRLTGRVIIELCENNFQKSNLVKNYSLIYPEDALLALMHLVANNSLPISIRSEKFINQLALISKALSIPKYRLPQEEFDYAITCEGIEENTISLEKTNFRKIYDTFDKKIEECRENFPNTPDINDPSSKEDTSISSEHHNTVELGKNTNILDAELAKEAAVASCLSKSQNTIEPETTPSDNAPMLMGKHIFEGTLENKTEIKEVLQGVKRDQYKYDVEATDLSLEIIDLKLSATTDVQEKIVLIEEKLRLVNKKQELAKKMEEFLLQQV